MSRRIVTRRIGRLTWMILTCLWPSVSSYESSSANENVRLNGALQPTPRRTLQESDSTSSGGVSLAQIPLLFSIWISANDGEASFERLVNTNEPNQIRNAIVGALQELLCTATDVSLIDATDVTNGESGASLCASIVTGHNQRHRWTQDDSESAASDSSRLDATPLIQVEARETTNATWIAPLQWTVWTATWTVLQMGTVYSDEASQNDPTMESSTLERAALDAMQRVLQLAVDVSAMDGSWDVLLQRRVTQTGSDATIVSSPVRREEERFHVATATTAAPLAPRAWYPMRVAGLLILVLTVGWVWGLGRLARRRRHRLTAAMSAGSVQVDANAVTLDTPTSVDAMLQRSTVPTKTQTTTALGSGVIPLSILPEEPTHSSALDASSRIDSPHNSDGSVNKYWTGHVVSHSPVTNGPTPRSPAKR